MGSNRNDGWPFNRTGRKTKFRKEWQDPAAQHCLDREEGHRKSRGRSASDRAGGRKRGERVEGEVRVVAEVVRGAAGRQMEKVRMEGVVIYRGVHVGVLCVYESAMGRGCVSA